MKRLSSAGQSHPARQDSGPNCARTSRHVRILTVLLLLLTLLLTLGVPGLAYAQVEPPATELESPEWKTDDKIGPGVRETLEAEGSVRVIVALETPGSLKRPDRSRFPQIRRDVEAGQNAVIGRLAAGEHSMRRRYRMTPAFAADIHTLAALDRLERHPLVVKIDLDEKVTAHLAESVPLIRADSMHARGYTGEGVVVAVLDTGIDTDHPDLADDLIHEECFMSGPYCHNGLDRQSGPGAAEDDEGHGTHVSGTITSAGIVSSVGVAPDVQIVAIKVLDSSGSGWASDILAGLDWILEYRPDVKLINMSLGIGLFAEECDLIAGFTVAMAEVINALRKTGVTTFASSGNDQSPFHLALPACLSGVVSVGATDDFDQVANFTDSNPYLDLLAPGVNIVADLPGGATGSGSGTSMASPHAVGCAALQLEAGRAQTPGSLEAWLKSTGVPVTNPKNGLTFPRVDCFAEPVYASSDELLAAAGPPDGTGGCGGTGSYTVDVIGGTISRTGDTAFNNWAVGYSCWGFDEQYARVYIVADDPATFDHWESPSGHMHLIDGHNGTSSVTIETSFNILGQSPTFEAVHTGGPPTPDLIAVNMYSGQGSIRGPLSGGMSSVYPALAVHPETRIMYAGGGDGSAVLHTVNPLTGALTPVGAAGSGISRIAAMDFRSDGTLFASVKVSGTGGPGANYLATISTNTGLATLVGSFGTCGVRCSIEGMGAIAFDDGGTLCGALHERAQNGTRGLYTINTSTGAATFVAPIVDASSTPLSAGITSLQFVDGALYGGAAIAKNPPGDGGWLVAINRTTGVFTKVGASSATGGRGLIGLAPPLSVSGPHGNHLADAASVGFLPYAGSGDNTDASLEPAEALGSCSSDHGNSVWWSFSQAEAGRYEFNTNGSSINTGLSIWTGAAHPLTELACDDNSGEGTASRLRFDAETGQEYFLRVIGLAGEEGSITINVFAPIFPVNDDLEDAISVMPVPSTVLGTNVDASREPHEALPSCAPDAGSGVWWRYTADESGPVYIHTEGSDFNTVLGVWAGDDHPLEEIACNDDFDFGTGVLSWLTFDATAGESYYIRVSGFRGAEGNIVLHTTTIGFDCAIQTDIPVSECEALVTFYESTGGPGWTNNTGWMITNEPCSWFGVTCLAGHVRGLALEHNNWAGSIPEAISGLTELRTLNLRWHELAALSGLIPDALGSLSNLRFLYLDGNSLSGPIPESLGNLTNLLYLYLDYNELSGQIPVSLGNLTNLQRLSLGYNNLTGPIPESLGNLTNLTFLMLTYNELTGSIPESLGNLDQLPGLFLAQNNLTGPIPASLGNLSNLTSLDLNYNSLTGPIPESLGNLSNLNGLFLRYNELSGPIPASLAKLSNLTIIRLEHNNLSGTIPGEIGSLPLLDGLFLHENDLSGPVPPTLGNLDALVAIDLSGNNLSGTVPLPVARAGASASYECILSPNPGLCIPDIAEYRAWASEGEICGLPLDPSCEPIVHAEAKVFLEGPYSGSAMQARPAFTDHSPSTQPYSDPVFDGTPLDCDHPDVVLSPPDSVMDWVLVSLRSGTSRASEYPGSERTAFLLTNGSIVDTSGSILAFPGVAPGDLRLVVRHRNHASVMSADTLDLSDGFGSWDYTTAMTQAYTASGAPMKQLPDGRFGMFACDANVDGQITAPDFNLWNAKTTAGATGYEQADCNLDGQVTAPDFNLWNANTTAGAASKVPD